MNRVTRRRIRQTCRVMLDGYKINPESLPIDVQARFERLTAGQQWKWTAEFVYDSSVRRFRDPFLMTGLMTYSVFDGSVTCNSCKSEKAAMEQSAYAADLLYAGLHPIVVIDVYRELSEPDSRGVLP